MGELANKSCAICNNKFICGDVNGLCWCDQFPAIMEMNTIIDCLCSDCLKIRIVSKIDEFVENVRIAELEKYDLKRFQNKELIESIDYYINESGNWVFTSWYHLKRGYCCKNGCKHCPWGYIKKIND